MKKIHAKAKQDKITGGVSSVVSNNLTASRALVSDANGKVAASSVTGTELNYLSGATSSIQTQINNKAAASDLTAHTSDTTKHITAAERTKWDGKQDAIIGAATTITGSNLRENMVMVTDGNGKVAASSSVTTTELSALNNYLVGEKGTIKTRFEAVESDVSGKQATVTGAATTITGSNLTASRALVSNSSGKVAVSAVTATELGYLDGVTSNIQTQLNAKAGFPDWGNSNGATVINIKKGETYTTTKNGYFIATASTDYGAYFNLGNIPFSITSGRIVVPVAAGVTIESLDEDGIVVVGRYMFIAAL